MWHILTHGGAGSPNEFSDGCEAACRRGAEALAEGGLDAALRAVVEAAAVLEDDPRFDAGTGSYLRMDGGIEQDAIVATSDGRIGSVACLAGTRNPIRVARLVMDSPHVMLCGEGATRFARDRGFPAHDCTTPDAINVHQDAMRRLATGELRPTEQRWRGKGMSGTVGAVARDTHGRFAVACSTGGTSLMLPGRVGDSPLFGAGAIAGIHGAVCCTGHGEEIIRHLAAMRCYLRLEAGEAAQAAVDATLATFPKPYDLGLIALAADSYGIGFTTPTMATHSLRPPATGGRHESQSPVQP